MNEKWYGKLTLWLALVLLVVALVIIGACGQTPEPTCMPEEEVSPSYDPDAVGADKWKSIKQGQEFDTKDELTFVKDEVIVLGRLDEVSRVVEEVLGAEALERSKYVLSLTDLLSPNALERLQGKWDVDWGGQRLVLASFPTFDILAEVAVLSMTEEAEDGVPFFAEVNLATEHPRTFSGSPQTWAGSPHTWAGSPQTWAGSPLYLEGEPVIRAFWGQWALGDDNGIRLVELGDPDLVTRTVESKGNDTEIAIFDSSPFDEPGIVTIDWITPDLTLSVAHVLARSVKPSEIISPADHGLFVSGLAHAVAPSSTVRLIRVLSDNLTGTLDVINLALTQYMTRSLEAKGTLEGTVINLSLGSAIGDGDHELIFPRGREDVYAEFLETVFDPDHDLELWAVPSLYFTLLLANSHGATIVASAGNDPDAGPDDREVPAAYPFVLGVEASGVHGGSTCYTKEALVAAPGGSPTLPLNKRVECPRRMDRRCQRGIISLAYRMAPCAGYACWAGSSFAAPLVSGMAALKLADCGGSISPGSSLQSVVVSGMKVTGSTQSFVINVPETIDIQPCP